MDVEDAVKVVLPPAIMLVDGDAEIVRTGARFTVKVAEDDVTVPQPETIALYLLLFIDALTLVIVRLVPVSPAMFVNVVPPSVLTCHWNVCPVPVDAIVKVALFPTHVALLTGCVFMTLMLVTLSVAAEDVTPVGHAFPTMTR